VSEVAVGSEVLSARGGVSWAVHEDVLDGLNQLATLASDLLRCVLWEKALSKRPDECVTCDDAV